MIGLDTNVLVRYIAQDDPKQSKAASRVIEKKCTQESPGFIAHIVLCELCWVLKRCYKADNSKISAVIDQILRTRQLEVEDPKTVWQALGDFVQGSTDTDWADCLINNINKSHGCMETLTFDKGASRLKGFTLVK